MIRNEQGTHASRSTLVIFSSMAALAISGPAAAQDAAWTPEWVDGVLQPLEDGFPERPITLVNTDDAGSPDGIYARTLQEILNDTSPQRVNILDRPSTSFGTWEAISFAQAEPGGDSGHVAIVLSVPAAALDLLTVDMETELALGLDDLNIVATTEETPYTMISRTGAPWGGSYEDMITYAREHPGEVRYLSREVGSAVDITMTWLFAQEGVEMNKIIGGSMQELGIAVAAGEVDIAMVFSEVALTHFQNERVEVLLMTGDEPIEPWTDKPAMSDVVPSENVQWGRVIGLTVPPEVPEAHREWLAELVRGATEDPRYQERGDTLPGRVLRIRDHEEGQALAQAITDLADPVVRELGLHFQGQ